MVSLGNVVHVGCLLHLESSTSSEVTQSLRLFSAAEDLGFESVWISHRPGYSRPSSPFAMLAAAAQRTRTIRLGLGVVIVPVDPVIRIVQDVCVLDALAEGRVEIGFGTGNVSPDIYRLYGVNEVERHDLYTARIAELTGRLEARGLQTGSTTHSRLWDASTSDDAVARAAAQGRGLMLGPGPHRSQVRTAQRFMATALGNRRQCGGRLAAVRGLYPAVAPDAHMRLRSVVSEQMQKRASRASSSCHGTGISERVLKLANIYAGDRDSVWQNLVEDEVVSSYATHLLLSIECEALGLNGSLELLERVASMLALPWGVTTSW